MDDVPGDRGPRRERLPGVACDSAGNSVVVGDVGGAGSTGPQAVTAKYRTVSGATMWVRYYNATITGDQDSLAAVSVGGSDQVFALGTSHTPAGDQMVTLSYTGGGLLRWAALYGGPAGAPADGSALALDPVSGAPYAVGFTADGAGVIDTAVVSYRR